MLPKLLDIFYPSVFTGYYMYTETSHPRVANDKAKLLSPKLRFSGAMCLQFAYHMYGSGMGTFNVYVHGVKRFSKKGDQLNTWHEEKIDVNVAGGMYTVRGVYEATLS